MKKKTKQLLTKMLFWKIYKTVSMYFSCDSGHHQTEVEKGRNLPQTWFHKEFFGWKKVLLNESHQI